MHLSVLLLNSWKEWRHVIVADIHAFIKLKTYLSLFRKK